jgi:site-specific recombinase XerC
MLERDLSPHTVRAYIGDAVALLGHVAGNNVENADVGCVDLTNLRSWLAAQRTAGASRTTLARRAAAARTFTAWAHRAGHLAADPGPRLAAPRPHRTLPSVLRADQAKDAMAAVSSGASEGDPVALRDQAVVELLYATGIRVAELCGLDLGDVDYSLRVIRVLGKGGRERSTPFGVPRRPRWPAEPAGRSQSGARGRRRGTGCTGHRAARVAPLRCDPFAGRRSGPAHRPRTAWSRYARNDSALHTRHCRTAEGDP